MRHYVLKREDGSVTCTFPWLLEGRPNLVKRIEPGLWKVSITSERGHVYVNLGKKCKSLEFERARVAKMAEGSPGRARTHMPGIAGYQEAENASTAAMASTHWRNSELADWLKEAS